jgi:DNA mismatch repair protein MSH3
MAKSAVSPHSQATISSFFSKNSPHSKGKFSKKRSTSPIDLTVDDEDRQPSKRAKISSTISTGRSTLSVTSCTPECTTGAAEKWRFSPEKPMQQSKSHTIAEESARKKRHEEFTKKLLSENSLFINRRKTTSASDDEAMDIDCGSRKSKSLDISEDELDGKWNDLQEIFSHKAKSNGKSNKTGKTKAVVSATSRGKQKVEDIGPSGETYTPLEQQVGYLLQCLRNLLTIAP